MASANLLATLHCLFSCSAILALFWLSIPDARETLLSFLVSHCVLKVYKGGISC